MTFYPAPSPYRASTGSMPVPIKEPNSSTSRRERSRRYEDRQDRGENYSSSHEDNPTLKLNTPFSSTPRGSSQALQPPSPEQRTRRSSHSGGDHPRILTRYPHGALVMEPATSSYGLHGSERRRRSSVSSPSVAESSTSAMPRSHARRSWQSYQQDIDIQEENTVRPGTTRIPRKLVNRVAAEQSGLPFEEERGTGAIVFKRALPKLEIERLVEATEAIRSRHAGKKPEAKKEKHVRIIPHPTEEIPAEADAPANKTYHASHSHSAQHQSRSYHEHSPRSSSLKVPQSDTEGAHDSPRRQREYRSDRSQHGGRSSSARHDLGGEKSGNQSDSGTRERKERGDREYRPHTLRYGSNGQREIVVVR